MWGQGWHTNRGLHYGGGWQFMANFDLSGRVALVSGASAGLGRHIAERLAQEGVAVALAARRTDRLDESKRLIEARGGRALAVACDVTAAASVQSAVAHAEAELGPI